MADFQSQSDAPTNGGMASENPGPSLGSKRQRRPSVRLGDIGEPSAAAAISYEAYYRNNKQWKVSRHGHLLPKELMVGKAATSSSKTRPLTNIGNGDSHETQELIDERNISGGDLDSAPASGGLTGSRKGREPKQKRGSMAGTKKVRTNWVLRVEGVGEGEHEKLSGDAAAAASAGVGDDEGFRDFDPEGSETPSKEHSPIRSIENTTAVELLGHGHGHGSEKEGGFPRRGFRTRALESREPDAVEELDVPSDMEGGDWRCGTSLEQNGGRERRFQSSHDDGVRSWLNELGLGRYAQVFEIHEVDEEVLPLLTLEDLKDMGINAVGSRRKMYCSIQKLRKGFS
ncbi:hypothetical protein MRB53_002083 [Persea americana]|uniref:Uncharacterized protein n=1 Tax=Persea americana TaxID=3435 RepID=A0ACC2MTK0_PERAE|nr:hypothetical protein MRB53_002083 [Persea americana]|eukprot:TRINITY_DN41353_c0_g1_i1.p1 TRINITY_DN41353_c0_g1~~TRINITY_DN41353_c0_g1_i1.p1  ORF type:complete len:343 (+),score=72.38 TRINITY_DN41353_c0_g1_i1:337-1365(+)